MEQLIWNVRFREINNLATWRPLRELSTYLASEKNHHD